MPQFQPIEILQEHGIAANDVQKLQNAGFHTIEAVSTYRNFFIAQQKKGKEGKFSIVFFVCSPLPSPPLPFSQ